ncbi:MAG TPA: DUF4252 domain-containing protein [Thermoanaerobaculia bacterium]|nr:DUF4252 domain-containing protein [Thermoanaerobaculia bacterium]
MKVLAALLLTAVLALPAAAQPVSAAASAAPLRLTQLQALEGHAAEVVEVTLDGELLRLAAGLMSGEEESDPELRALLGQLRGVYVNSYVFAEDGAYDRGIVQRLRGGLGSGWQRMVNVRSRGAENVEIWVRPAGSRFDGLVIFAAEPRELTVVQLVGSVDVDTLARLEGHLGVPRLGVAAAEAGAVP